jgi:hypothetical protein
MTLTGHSDDIVYQDRRQDSQQGKHDKQFDQRNSFVAPERPFHDIHHQPFLFFPLLLNRVILTTQQPATSANIEPATSQAGRITDKRLPFNLISIQCCVLKWRKNSVKGNKQIVNVGVISNQWIGT